MNKVVIIIGASDGIGKQTAELFLKNKDIVYNLSRHECQLENINNKELDIVNSQDLDNIIAEIGNKHGQIDVLINSAGFSMASPLEYAESHDYKYLFDVNLFGIIQSIKSVTHFMKQNGGRIINISSMAGVFPIPYDPYYSAAKAAVNMFTEALSFELEKWGIYVTSVMPGGTSTHFTYKRKVYGEQKTKEYSDDVEHAVETLNKMEQLGMHPKRVGEHIFVLANTPNPPILSIVGCKNRLMYCFGKFIPRNCVHKIIKRKYHLEG